MARNRGCSACNVTIASLLISWKEFSFFWQVKMITASFVQWAFFCVQQKNLYVILLVLTVKKSCLIEDVLLTREGRLTRGNLCYCPVPFVVQQCWITATRRTLLWQPWAVLCCKCCDCTWKSMRLPLALPLLSAVTEPACPDSQRNESSDNAVCAACVVFCFINGQCLS